MPLGDQEFDVAWRQAGWLNIDDKEALLGECIGEWVSAVAWRCTRS